MTAARADLGVRGEEELHLGLREHDGADVTAFEDDTARGSRLPLQVEEDVAYLFMGGDRARALSDVRHADRVAHVLAAERDADAGLRVAPKVSACSPTMPRAIPPT